MEITLERKDEAYHFEATNEEGNIVSIDGSPDIGGHGLGTRPMQMLVMALGGCSGIDVVSILTKQKSNPDDLNIKLTAEREGGVPSSFKTIHAHFILQGDIDPKKVERAVRLSMEKYCSVGFILSKSCEITWSYEVNGISYNNKLD